jgi:hypothetical protein
MAISLYKAELSSVQEQCPGRNTAILPLIACDTRGPGPGVRGSLGLVVKASGWIPMLR